MLTIQEVTAAVPATLKASINQSFVDTLNQLQHDPDVAEAIRDNFITHAGVIRDGKYKMQDYLNAVTYVMYKHMDYSNHDAWCATFPQRHAALVAAGKSKKEMSSHVSMYAKGQLVNKVLEQSMVETWLLNRDLEQKAINKLASLMETAASEKVQCDAAIGLASLLAKPKAVGPAIQIDINENSGMNELTATLERLAQQQLHNLRSGSSTIKDINGQRIFDAPAGPVAVMP